MKNQKKIGTIEVLPAHTHRDNWEVMRPFVKFAWGAVKIMGLTLIGIIKLLPALKPHSESSPSKAIKVR